MKKNNQPNQTMKMNTIETMILTALTLASLCSCGGPNRVETPESERHAIVAFVSNGLGDDQAKASVYEQLALFALRDLEIGDRLDIYDGSTLARVTSFEVPPLEPYRSDEALRADEFQGQLNAFRLWLEHSQGETPLSLDIPEIYRFVGTLQLPAGSKCLLVGSPIFTKSSEVAWSMADNFYPSDGAIAAGEESVYGVAGAKDRLAGIDFHWAYMGDPFMDSAHRSKVERFWAAYTQEQSATLRSGEIHLGGVMPRLSNGYRGAITCTDFDPEAKVEMIQSGITIRVNRSQPEAPAEIDDSPFGFLTTSSVASEPLAVDTVGQVKVGAKWSMADTDIDIYVKRRGYSELFYGHNRNSDGSRHVKDHLTPPDDGAFEVVDFGEDNPVKVSDLSIAVNNYNSPRTGEPIPVTVRLQVGSRVYSTTAYLEANGGDGGSATASRNGSKFWKVIDVAALCAGEGQDA